MDQPPRQHDWLDITLAGISDGVTTIDRNGAITFMNRAAEELTGWIAAEAVGRPVMQVVVIIDGSTRQPVDHPALATLKNNRPARPQPDTLLLDRDGETVPVSTSTTPIRNTRGKAMGSVLVLRDLSSNLRAQEAVEQSLALVERVKREWESTADSLPQLVCLLDSEGRVIRANRTTEAWDLLEVTRVPGTALHDLLHPGCWDDDCYMNRLWKEALSALGEGRAADWEVEDRTLRKWFHVQFRPMVERLDGRKLVSQCAAVAIFEDITERKLLEMELAQAREQEIEIGSKIQQSLLIGEPPRDMQGLAVSAMSIASQKIDGDFYTFFQHDDKTLDVIVGDVMGKGVPAALIGAATKNHFLGAMSNLIARTGAARLPEPEEVVTHVHTEMADRLIKLDSFVTLCYARFDLENNRVTIVDCGHPRILHYRRSGGRCVPIEGLNMPLGFSSTESYDQKTVPFEQGDAFLFYSDGVIEAREPGGDLFGQERLLDFFVRNGTSSPGDVIEGICSAVIGHAGSADFSDDLTCIAVRIDDARPRKPESKTMEATSDLSELEPIRTFVRDYYEEQYDWEHEEEEAFALELAVNEAAANIIRHAYGGRPGRPIWLHAERSGGQIIFTLRHEGEAFDPEDAPPPVLDGTRDSGYGLHIINHSVDEVTFADEGKGRSIIRLVKDCSQERKENTEHELLH